MRVVSSTMPPGLVEWRRRIGADGHDEMWAGVLHMNPVPNRDHQELVGHLYWWLRTHWSRQHERKVYPERNVAAPGGWPNDYRVPDLVLMTSDRFGLDQNEYIEGGPTVMIEIRSPEDETYEKLPFYATIGAEEVWVIQRDTKTPQIYRLERDQYGEQSPNEQGWISSKATGIQLRSEGQRKVAIRMASDEETFHVIPED